MATLLMASPSAAGSGHRSLAFVRVAELAIILAAVLLCLPVVHALAGIAAPDAVDQGVAVVRGVSDVLRLLLITVLLAGALRTLGDRASDGADVGTRPRRYAPERRARRMPGTEWRRQARRATGTADRDASDDHLCSSHPHTTTLRSHPNADASGGSFAFYRHVHAPPPRGGPVAQPGVR